MSVRTPLVALAVYMLMTAVLGRHVLAELGTSIAKDPGDPLLTAAILHWNAHHIPLTDAWWQFPIFYPTRDALAFSEHLLGVSAIASPISWATGNSLTTYNLTLLLTFPLCGMSMYALVYRLTGSVAGAFIAGLAYAFAPYRVATLSHIQMLASFWAPLALLGLHGFIEAGRPSMTTPLPSGFAPQRSLWWLALYGTAWLLQALANGYMLVFFSVFVGLWVIWFVVVPRLWRALAAIAVTTVIATVPLAPILYKYVIVHARHGFERGAIEWHAFSADVAAVFCAPATLTVWGWLRVACRAEGELFPGVAVIGLFVAGFALLTRRPPRRPLVWMVRVLLAVALVYAAIIAIVLFTGPLRVDVLFVHFTASAVAKPLLIAIAAGALALMVSVASRGLGRSPSVPGFYLFAAVMTWLFALGPMLILMGEESGRPGPFVWLQWIPGAAGLRVPARFWLLTVLALSASAGITIARLGKNLRPQEFRALAVLATCAILADSWTPGIRADRPPSDVPDAAALRGAVVLQLPVARDLDSAATWRAVVGGWKSVNGFSGYAPNYYFALTQAGRTGEAFAPFRHGHALHVIVPDSAPALQMLVTQQAAVVRTTHGHGWRQYQLASLTDTEGELAGRIPIAAVRSPCEPSDLRFALDGDLRSNWQCSMRDRQEVTAELRTPSIVGGLVYNLGPYWWNAPDRLIVATSRDGVTWEDAPTRGVLAALIESGFRDPKTISATLSFDPRQARYVRLRGEGAAAEFLFVVSELELRQPRTR